MGYRQVKVMLQIFLNLFALQRILILHLKRFPKIILLKNGMAPFYFFNCIVTPFNFLN